MNEMNYDSTRILIATTGFRALTYPKFKIMLSIARKSEQSSGFKLVSAVIFELANTSVNIRSYIQLTDSLLIITGSSQNTLQFSS